MGGKGGEKSGRKVEGWGGGRLWVEG